MTVLSIQGCSRQTLEPWHTVELTEEFSTDRTDEVPTFDDYRQLEGRLFEQLDSEVYSRIETGPGYALVRYSKGSAADPRNRQPDWNRSVELPVDTPAGGVLLLHGMSDSPYSLRALGESLHRRDLWVVGLRLPGHGTAPSGLTGIKWEDMAAAVQMGVEHLASKVDRLPIHIIGYSTGAPLAIHYALDALEGQSAPVPAGLVLISPAIGIHPAARLAKWKRRLSVLPGLGGIAWLQIHPEFDPYKYNSFAANAAEQVHRLTVSVTKRIASRSRSHPDTVLPPTLVIHSTVDATVSTTAVVDRLLKPLAPGRHRLVLFDINRSVVHSTLLVSDPGPLTAQLMDDGTLPFEITLVTNENPESTAMVVRRKPPFSSDLSTTEPLDLSWPAGVISLSHVALPFPPDDPLYGAHPPENRAELFLGRQAIQGERGLLKLPADWLLRLRYNPFYPFLEERVHEWINENHGQTARSDNLKSPRISSGRNGEDASVRPASSASKKSGPIDVVSVWPSLMDQTDRQSVRQEVAS
jgi:alpha-beta hydrolase superfamily lysophospholipase